jgi:hypothetical protein
MLIEQLAGALGLRILALAFSARTAESCAIGGRVLLGAFARRAFPELFQVDQVPHAGPRHADLIVVKTMPTIDECVRVPCASKSDGYAQVGSILIMKFPIMQADRKCRASIFYK